ncbi:MAG: DNA-protecting protein DprA [Deltaproteobacteria bacterium CG07_land_8_20_14_0_80_38_7]|nr:MAG: DNA-protecting protein DprA [Deltaproteobacteria bacterium CG07_land_8_20_14_0_80_38_7]
MKERTNFLYWLALQHLYYQKPLSGLKLIEKFGDPKKIFDLASKLQNFDELSLVRDFNSREQCEEDLKKIKESKITILNYSDLQYPKLLKEIHDPPLVIMVRGNIETLNKPCVAIVGSRLATEHGREVAFELAEELASEGICVVSGMAYGIDASAHKGALNKGETIAVWGSGIDVCYPASFVDLSKRIERSGCIVSEFPLGTKPAPYYFPQRNRIISGLSIGIVVVEAKEKSGSLITAKFALDQGREIFAVPGMARGCANRGNHKLLKEGAVMVESGDEILEVLRPHLPLEFKNPRHLSPDDNNVHPILNLVRRVGEVNLDIIVKETRMSCSDVLKELTRLIMDNAIEELPGKRFREKTNKE